MELEKTDAPAPPSRFAPGADLRATILDAFGGTIGAAQAAAREPSTDEAVHEMRKALRRARAILRLVADTLRRDDRRDLARAIVEARRALSPSRDLAVVPGAIATAELDDDARATATAVVAGAQEAALPVEDVRRTLADAAAKVAPLPEAMAAALPARLGWSDLREGLADTYGDARRALRRAKGSTAQFHRFRKRAKELAYQLELLADGIDGRTDAIRGELTGLGDELGDVVDVVMLRDFVAARAGDADGDGLRTLIDTLDDRVAARIKAARRRARDLFDRKPRRFARRVVKGARRDHAPVAAPPAPVAEA